MLHAGGKIGEFCQVLFPLIVANTDDWGRMPADAFTVKNVVLPSSRRPERDFERALSIIDDVGLIDRYRVGEVIYLQVIQFDAHQPNLHKRLTSKFPESPGSSGKIRPNLRESNLRESNLIQSNPEPCLPAQRAADSLFAQFWDAYPKKKAKEAALKAWDKRKPTSELLSAMLSALERQKVSPDWLKDSGRFIPFPATWLNQARWTDEVEVDLQTLPENKRVSGLMVGGQAFLNRRQG